jgi:hypothetical protein
VPKLKLGRILDDRPVKLAIELPAQVNRDLVAYAEVLARETGQAIEPAKLIAPMLERFMSTDRAFARSQRSKREPDQSNRASSLAPKSIPSHQTAGAEHRISPPPPRAGVADQ